MKSITYLKISIIGTLLALACFAGITIYVDPLFHYHAPLERFQYPLYDERYMNDGITRNFDYNAIITGSSMTENFKTSLFDDAFGTNAIKVPFSGGSYKEINDMLVKAFDRNDNIAYVMRSLDSTMLIADKDAMDYTDYPSYLYDDNLFNDVSYVLNKDVLFTFTDYVFTYNKLGGITTSFDTYKNWSGNYLYDGEKLRTEYQRRELSDTIYEFTQEDLDMLTANLEQNVLTLVRENPDTQFYLFIPPYSILAWDDWNRLGHLDRVLDAHEKSIEILLEYDNVHLYSYFDNPAIICNLNLYIDSLHYDQQVSDYIIHSMAAEEGLLTKDNYKQYMATIREFYQNFDYDTFMSTGQY